MSVKNGMRPVHPGEVLREDFMNPSRMNSNVLARALRVPPQCVFAITSGRRRISADIALRLARFFGGDARSWLNLQITYDLRVAEIANTSRIEREVMRREGSAHGRCWPN